ncbi:MAG: PQQ-binding-like beta-propeller repeat protein [Cypionkella sp.]
MAVMTSGKIGLSALLCLGLAGCERDVILQGERFDVRTPLEASAPVEGQPAPKASDFAPQNQSVAISIPGQTNFAEWSHRGGSARHTAGDGALSSAPQRVWSANIGARNSKRARVSASPVVSGGRVFAMDAAGHVTAISTGGGVLWQVGLAAEFDRGEQAPGGGLAVQGKRVFATTGDGELVALDAGSGAVLWRQRFDTPVTGAPTVDGNAVYAIGSDGGAMAVAADSGKVLWTVEGTTSSAGMVGAASPAVADGVVMFPFASGEIAGVDPKTGEKKWIAAVAGQRVGRAYAALGDVTGDPVVVGGTAYAGTAAGRTIALNATTGLRDWVATEGALNPPLVVGGSVFVVNDQAELVRLDAATGEVIWRADMPYFVKDKPKKLKAIYAHYGPVLAGGRIVVASSDGLLRMFDPTNGAMVGSADIPGGAASAPALAGGMLFVVGGNGQLHAFR